MAGKGTGEDVGQIRIRIRRSDRPAATFWRTKGLSTRSANALACAGIEDFEQLRAARNRLAKIPNLGKVSQTEIESLLENKGGGS